jgi:hypothetical protein
MSGTFHGSDIDTVQLNNGNLHIDLPLFTMSGRGPGVAVKYVYDSKGWYEKTLNSAQDTPVYVYPKGVNAGGQIAAPGNNMGWATTAPLTGGAGFWGKLNTTMAA